MHGDALGLSGSVHPDAGDGAVGVVAHDDGEDAAVEALLLSLDGDAAILGLDDAGDVLGGETGHFFQRLGVRNGATNCLMRPRDSYKDRIYSTNVVGWDGVKHIGKNENGEKDFSAIIEQALELGGYPEDQDVQEILVGFGHHATLGYADAIVDAVKSGKLRHFFLIGGCDGARPGRNYYTEFAEMVPQDCLIMTLACGKYRFNKLDFGEVAGLPRLLDIGQCNDVYSAIRIATALADAFGTDVNGLPLSLIISWYEQKAVADLLALLSLGIHDIYLGPTLPAFLSPNVLQYLTDTFHLKSISNARDDIRTCLGQAV